MDIGYKIEDYKVKETIIRTDSKGCFFDVSNKEDTARITDYSLMDKEIQVKEAKGIKEIICGAKKEKIIIKKIDSLMKVTNLFLEAALGILNLDNEFRELDKFDYWIDDIVVTSESLENKKQMDQWLEDGTIKYRASIFKFVISDKEKQLLVEQLVFDMLYHLYLNNSPKMTVGDYIKNFEKKHQATSIFPTRGTLQNGMKEYSKKMLQPEYKEQLGLLGIDAEIYSRYFLYNNHRDVKKPCYVWNWLFYNKYMVTAKQYRRQLTKKNRNNSYEELSQYMSDYHQFIKELLPTTKDYGDTYLHKTMDYYEVESYKRIDFMCKLAIELPKMEAEAVEFMIRRFTPLAMIVFDDKGMVGFDAKIKYYKSMLRIEDLLLEDLSKGCDSSIVGRKLINYQIIRAKTLELMKYHINIETLDYRDAESFLRKYFDMSAYHESNKLWSMIDGSEYSKKNDKEKGEINKIIKKIIDINDLLFK